MIAAKKCRQSGYTVTEVMMSLVILFVVLVPASRFLSYLMIDRTQMDRINGAAIAESVLEKTLLYQNFRSSRFSDSLNSKYYRVEKIVQERDSLYFIDVKVFASRQQESLKPIIQLYKFHLREDSASSHPLKPAAD